MPLANDPLLSVLETHYYVRDALTVADRVVDFALADRTAETLLVRTCYLAAQRDEVTEKLLRSFDEWEDYTILSLWVVFERELVAFITQRFQYVRGPKDTQELEEALRKGHNDFVDRARMDDKLKLFDKTVPEDYLKQARRIRDYRDWVAHQNPNKLRPPKIDPETCFLYLTCFLDALN